MILKTKLILEKKKKETVEKFIMELRTQEGKKCSFDFVRHFMGVFFFFFFLLNIAALIFPSHFDDLH